ncbi:MAG TPA: BON domain-containing protein [Acidimicrobiia bacterium]|nr:BON domain-containing protein [Acidimicrobiia bacterium]
MKSDEELRRDVLAELEYDPSIDARKIGVAVEDGIVTLTGEVPSFAEKWNAERAVERVEGVRGIVNKIEVKPIGEFGDADIAREAADALRWNLMVPPGKVIPKVENGYITLTGEVNYEFQRRAAEKAVRYIPGVKGVINLVTVKPKVEPKNVKEKIEETFKRMAALDAENISVEVNGSEVILRGTVRSWAERHEAEKAAWAAPGVTSVKNYITVKAVA